MAERRHQYDPPTNLVAVPGVRVERNVYGDVYRGSKEDLATMGLVPVGQFPGDAGMPITSVTLWPRGTPRGSGCRVPGMLSITRNPRGSFTALLVPSYAEQQLRKVERERQNEQQERAPARPKMWHSVGDAVLDDAAVTLVDAAITRLGWEKVAAHVERVGRGRSRRCPAGHLQLVWSAPQVMRDRMGPQ